MKFSEKFNPLDKIKTEEEKIKKNEGKTNTKEKQKIVLYLKNNTKRFSKNVPVFLHNRDQPLYTIYR